MKVSETKPSICNCLNLRRASAAITRIYDRHLVPSGLSVSQYSILQHVKQFGPVSVSDLAAKIRLDRTTLVRNLKPLEAAGLIADASAQGARNRQLRLTEAGAARCEQAEHLWSDAQDFMMQKLGQENIRQLTGLLSMIERI